VSTEDRYFVGSEQNSCGTADEKDKLTSRLRQYLGLRHVGVLIGNGASLNYGSPQLRSISSIVGELEDATYALQDAHAQTGAIALLKMLTWDGVFDLPVEPFLTELYHLQSHYALLPNMPVTIDGHAVSREQVQDLDRLIKKWLYRRCRTAGQLTLELASHQELLRRLLLRPTSLPRIKVFTTNYDDLIERALDALGIAYFDGFIGTIARTFRSESYHYDLYFPGETTEGRVSRVDRVLQFYKLHGSINWRRRRQEYLLDVIMDLKPPQDDAGFGEVMIYPSPLKVTEMHGYPYSEMFRHFAAQIHQPQSVLFTIGYAFNDDHLNRLIYQALSIPSFVLVIVLPAIAEPNDPTAPTAAHEVWRLIHKVASKRILVLTGGVREGALYTKGLGTLQGFATEWLPDVKELAIQAKVSEEVQQAFARRDASTPAEQ